MLSILTAAEIHKRLAAGAAVGIHDDHDPARRALAQPRSLCGALPAVLMHTSRFIQQVGGCVLAHFSTSADMQSTCAEVVSSDCQRCF